MADHKIYERNVLNRRWRFTIWVSPLLFAFGWELHTERYGFNSGKVESIHIYIGPFELWAWRR